MCRGILYKVIVAAALSLASVVASAQAYSGYTPYSIYGVGDVAMPGTAYNRSMAGVGIAGRNNRFINIINPAAVTARDTLAFMMDVSLFSENRLYTQNGASSKLTSANNTLNIGDIVMTFPLYRSSAMMVGITPYSSVGYNYSITDAGNGVLANLGDVTYTNSGMGCIYQMFFGAGATFWKKFSVGAELLYYFGNISKSAIQDISASAVNEVQESYDIHLNAVSGKFGAQFEQKIGSRNKLILGATYTLGTKFGGNIDYKRLSVGTVETIQIAAESDTLNINPNKVNLAGEFGLGASFSNDRLKAEIDYTRSDWRDSRFDTHNGFANSTSALPFSATVKNTVRVGVEYVPNRNDIRYYFKKCAYRAGAYYSNEYYKVAGKDISAYGVTLGITLPVFRWYNGVTLAVDLGKRGSLSNGLVRENYANISVGVNLFDIWFQKPMYE